MDWDIAGGATAVLLDRANTYTSGMRQSVSHDTANAGLRIVPVAGDPAGRFQDGDVWYNQTTGKFRRRQNGAYLRLGQWRFVGKSFNPHDTSWFWMVEDFTFRGPFSSQNYGQYGWYNENIASGCGSNAYSNGTTNHPSMVTLATTTAVNVGCDATLDAGNLHVLRLSLPPLRGRRAGRSCRT